MQLLKIIVEELGVPIMRKQSLKILQKNHSTLMSTLRVPKIIHVVVFLHMLLGSPSIMTIPIWYIICPYDIFMKYLVSKVRRSKQYI